MFFPSLRISITSLKLFPLSTMPEGVVYGRYSPTMRPSRTRNGLRPRRRCNHRPLRWLTLPTAPRNVQWRRRVRPSASDCCCSVSLIFLRISSEVFCRGRAADSGLSSLTMTSLSFTACGGRRGGRWCWRVSWRCSSSDPFGPGRDPGRGLCRCMIDYNFGETDVFRER
jgi:hypothetical protein